MIDRICDNCRTELSELADFCYKCGKRLPKLSTPADPKEKEEYAQEFCQEEGHKRMIVLNLGIKIMDLKFCPICGKKLPKLGHE